MNKNTKIARFDIVKDKDQTGDYAFCVICESDLYDTPKFALDKLDNYLHSHEVMNELENGDMYKEAGCFEYIPGENDGEILNIHIF